MDTKLFVKNGKKYEAVSLPPVASELFFDAFVPASKATNERKEQAASVLASTWDAIVAKYAEGDSTRIDRIEVTDYEVTRMVKGTASNHKQTATISNLNMVAVLSGIAERVAAKQEFERKTANVKALIASAVKFETHGYTAGKRGRQSHSVTNEQATQALKDALGL